MFSFLSLRPLFFVLFFTIFLNSCSILQKFQQKSYAEKASVKSKNTLSVLQKTSRKSKSDKTLKQLEEFISQNSKNELLMPAYLLKAKILERQKKYKKACEVYHEATKLSYLYKEQSQAFFAFAKCLFKDKHIKQALNALEQIVQNSRESKNLRRRAVQIQWRAVQKQKNLSDYKLKILSHLVELYPQAGKKESWKKQARNLLFSLDKKTLTSVSKKSYEYSAFEGMIFYRIAKLLWKNQKIKKSHYYFVQALSHELDSDLEKDAKFHVSMIKSMSQVNSYLIGVLLPLSGPKKSVGQKILRGLTLGLELNKDSPWQMLVMDSKAQADVTKASLEKLFNAHHIIGLVGGVTNETADVIVEAASSFGIPSILFSQKVGLSKDKDFIFQNALTSSNVIEHLSKNIRTRKLNIRKVAILSPEDSYGQHYAKIFRKIFRKQGGRVVAHESYKPKEINFDGPIKKLVNLYDLEKRQKEYEQLKKEYVKKHPHLSKRSKKLEAKSLLKPKFDFEAIFIPDSFENVQKIESYLKYYGVKEVYLLGTNLWSQKYVQRWSKQRPLVFVGTPAISNESINRSSFYKVYKETFLKAPGFIERQAFNTALVFKKALEKGAKNRLQLNKQIKSLASIQGAFFEFEISAEGSFIYPLEVFVTKDNRVLTLDSIPD